MKPRIVIAGGNGFLGKLLTDYFTAKDWRIVILGRTPQDSSASVKQVAWDGESLGDWADDLEGATALVNLAGRSVDCRYHQRNRDLIMHSRIKSTRVLGEAVARCKMPPQVWLNSSTATIYKHTFDAPHDETGIISATPEAKDAFSIEVATAWEETFNQAMTPGTRKIALRTAMVLADVPGTVFRVLRRLVRLGLGGAMGDGRQFMSWIHAEDFCRAIEWLIENPNADGIYNICAPNPVPNRELMRIFRRVCDMPIGLPATKGMLEIGAFFLRTETELIIKSRRVIPGRLLIEGFAFQHAEIEAALNHLNGNPKHSAA